jgi:hypothetical protein
MPMAYLTFQDGIHRTAVQRVPKVVNGRHEEDFLWSLWQEVNNEFGVGRNGLHGFVQWLSCNTGRHRAQNVKLDLRINCTCFRNSPVRRLCTSIFRVTVKEGKLAPPYGKLDL